MDYKKLIKEYVNELAQDMTKTGGIKFILVFITNDGVLHYNIGNELDILIDTYDVENLNMEKALKIELAKNNSIVGAIFMRKDENNFELMEGLGF